MNLAEIRQTYPQYDDLPDEELAKGLHSTFYSDLDFEDFSGRIGLQVAPDDIEDPKRTVLRTAGDIAVSTAKGVVAFGASMVGLVDIPTFGRVGKAAKDFLGFDPGITQDTLSSLFSDAQQEANRRVSEAKGFIDTAKAMITNPTTIAASAIESFPLLLGGAGAARALISAGVKISPLVAGALFEGVISAGSSAEQIRQQTEDGVLTLKQSLASVVSGVGTSAFALAGGRLAKKLGIVDVDTLLAGSGFTANATGVIKRIVGGGISEGVFEELPQSMQEQIWQNAALDKPLLEGAFEAGATGLLTGAAVGGGIGIVAPTLTKRAIDEKRAELDPTSEKDAVVAEALDQAEENEVTSQILEQLPDRPTEEIEQALSALPVEDPLHEPMVDELTKRIEAEEEVADEVEKLADAIEEAEKPEPTEEITDVEKAPEPAELRLLPGEEIGLPALRTPEGKVAVGEIHADALADLTEAEREGPLESGFTTTEGRFLTLPETERLFGAAETGKLADAALERFEKEREDAEKAARRLEEGRPEERVERPEARELRLRDIREPEEVERIEGEKAPVTPKEAEVAIAEPEPPPVEPVVEPPVPEPDIPIRTSIEETAKLPKRAQETEQRWLIDGTSKETIDSSVKRDNTRFEPNVDIDIVKHMGKDVVDIHTHPDTSFPSAEDWAMLFFGHAKSVRTVLEDGTVVELTKPSGVKGTPRSIKDAWHKFEDEIFDSGRSRDLSPEEIIFEINQKLAAETGVKIATKSLSDFKGEAWAEGLQKPKEIPPEPKPTAADAKKRLLDIIKAQRGSFSLRDTPETQATFNDLLIVGRDIYAQGNTTLKAFSRRMQTTLSEVWDKIKHIIKQLFDSAKAVVMDERGVIGDKPELPSLLQRYVDEFVAKEVVPEQKPAERKTAEKDFEAGMSEITAEDQKGPTFADTKGPVTNEDILANRKIKKSIKKTVLREITRFGKDVVEGVDEFLGVISTRLGNISPEIKARLRELEFDIGQNHIADKLAVLPLLQKAKKMSSDDFKDWDYVRKNSDTIRIDALVAKYDMKAEYDAARGVLDRVREEGIDVGLDIGQIDEYWPRILKDPKGFLTAIGKDPNWNIYDRKLQERANELDIDLAKMPIDMKADIIANMILGGGTGLGGISATKSRKLEKIPPILNQYYMDSDSAMVQHLYHMRKGIELRKFFGRIPQKVGEMRRRLHTAQTKIRNLNKLLGTKLSEKEREKIRKRRNKWIGLEKQYEAYIARYAIQRDYTENIGQWVMEKMSNGEVGPGDQQTLNDILNARFHEVGTRGRIQQYKNLSYIDTMGSPVSALTQIGDLAWAAYDSGLVPTLKNAAKALGKKSRITKEELGFERIAQEFASSDTLSNAVAKVFKWVQLERIDTVGKEALANGALEKFEKMARKNPEALRKQIEPILKGRTDATIQSLIDKEITDNVKLIVFNRVLDFQPVALTEVPQKYLTAGNGRIFYMLKTFTIKQFDIFRNEVYNKIRDSAKAGDKRGVIQGLQNLFRLTAYFVIANAGADELKDWMLGRKTDFGDRVWDNVLRLAGISKFVIWKARTEGVGSALLKQLLFPVKFIDSFGRDIINAGDDKGVEMLSSVPVIGKLLYWHIGRGVGKRQDLWDRRLRKEKARLNKIKEKLDRSENKEAFKLEHRKDLKDLRRVNALQGRLNVKRKAINRLKSKAGDEKRIQQIEDQRTELIKAFLKR